MTPRAYPIPVKPHSVELKISKSRFIGTLHRVCAVEEMQHFLSLTQKQHPKADHHCWAVVAGVPWLSTLQRCSDDGEPSGTAGKPILSIMQHKGIGQAGIIITRYFGGIKLGKGGLVRAYGDTAKRLIETAVLMEHRETVSLRCIFSYEQEHPFRHLLQTYTVVVSRFSYAEMVTAEIEIDISQAVHFSDELHVRLGCIIQPQPSQKS